MWFINEDGFPYEWSGTVAEQNAKYPNDDPTPYATEADAIAEIERIEDEMSNGALRAADAYYSSYDDGYDHYERFGRPAFPNEY